MLVLRKIQITTMFLLFCIPSTVTIFYLSSFNMSSKHTRNIGMYKNIIRLITDFIIIIDQSVLRLSSEIERIKHLG